MREEQLALLDHVAQRRLCFISLKLDRTVKRMENTIMRQPFEFVFFFDQVLQGHGLCAIPEVDRQPKQGFSVDIWVGVQQLGGGGAHAAALVSVTVTISLSPQEEVA